MGSISVLGYAGEFFDLGCEVSLIEVRKTHFWFTSDMLPNCRVWMAFLTKDNIRGFLLDHLMLDHLTIFFVEIPYWFSNWISKKLLYKPFPKSNIYVRIKFYIFTNKRVNGTGCMNYTCTLLHPKVVECKRKLRNTTHFL